MATTLVLGGTGKTGRRVAHRLAERGLPVRIGSRSGTPSFDWTDRGSWPAALAGVDAVYVSFYPDVAVPGSAEVIRSLAEAAVASGVRRLVLLSGRGEAEAQESEQALRDVAVRTGTEWTVVRASWFNQNFSEGYMLDPVLEGVVALPVGPVPEPFVDADDIADVAVAALTQDGHSGQIYEVTGPRMLTFADAVTEIAEATGREVRFIPVTMGEYADALTSQGVPADVVSLLQYLFIEVLDGRNAHLTDGVQRALGRPPRDFGDYVKATAAAGAWDR